jgi:hypothetical protein
MFDRMDHFDEFGPWEIEALHGLIEPYFKSVATISLKRLSFATLWKYIRTP